MPTKKLILQLEIFWKIENNFLMLRYGVKVEFNNDWFNIAKNIVWWKTKDITSIENSNGFKGTDLTPWIL